MSRARAAVDVVTRGAVVAVLAVGGAGLGLVGAFLSGTVVHPAGVPLPVGVLTSVVALPVVCAAAGRATGSWAAASAPYLSWLAVAFVLSTSRREGDLVVTGETLGLVFLLVGAVAGAVGVVVGGPSARRRRTLPGPDAEHATTAADDAAAASPDLDARR